MVPINTQQLTKNEGEKNKTQKPEEERREKKKEQIREKKRENASKN